MDWRLSLGQPWEAHAADSRAPWGKGPGLLHQHERRVIPFRTVGLNRGSPGLQKILEILRYCQFQLTSKFLQLKTWSLSDYFWWVTVFSITLPCLPALTKDKWGMETLVRVRLPCCRRRLKIRRMSLTLSCVHTNPLLQCASPLCSDILFVFF